MAIWLTSRYRWSTLRLRKELCSLLSLKLFLRNLGISSESKDVVCQASYLLRSCVGLEPKSSRALARCCLWIKVNGPGFGSKVDVEIVLIDLYSSRSLAYTSMWRFFIIIPSILLVLHFDISIILFLTLSLGWVTIIRYKYVAWGPVVRIGWSTWRQILIIDISWWSVRMPIVWCSFAKIFKFSLLVK